MSDLLRAADRQAEQILGEAKGQADRVLAEARADADRVRLDAQSKAEEARAAGALALKEARERADQTVAGLAMKRENLVEQLQTMQERLLTVARDLEATIVPADGSAMDAAAVEEPSPARAEVPVAAATSLDAPPIVDPRYEDLWASGDMVDLTMPEIPPLDLGFEDLEESEDEGD